MTKHLKIAFLWHMHQPYYIDPLTNRASMPWVRLHGTKSYYDMIRILDEFPSIKATFNLVPALLKQLIEYTEGNIKDTFLEYTMKPASDLTEDERRFILTNFFMANWETIISPNKGYLRVLEKRGRHIYPHTIGDAVKSFGDKDITDLQTWFNLGWFGFKAEEEYEEIRKLKKKGRNFSEDEKKRMIDIQMEILKKIIPAYKKAEERGQIELTTSPFYHPIMRSSGISWTATDEGILFRTIGKKDKAEYLYKPYKAVYHDKDVSVIFRDQGLSDLVGFTYSKNPQAAAAHDLIQHFYEIRNAVSDKPHLVLIILDGA